MPPAIPHKTVDGIEMKFCSGHNEYHKLDDFGKDSKSPDKLRNMCKVIKNELSKKQYEKTKTKTSMTEEEHEQMYLKISEKLKRKFINENGKLYLICNECKLQKELTEFPSDGKKYANGETKYRNTCGVCRYKQRKQALQMKTMKTDNKEEIEETEEIEDKEEIEETEEIETTEE